MHPQSSAALVYWLQKVSQSSCELGLTSRSHCLKTSFLFLRFLNRRAVLTVIYPGSQTQYLQVPHTTTPQKHWTIPLSFPFCYKCKNLFVSHTGILIHRFICGNNTWLHLSQRLSVSVAQSRSPVLLSDQTEQVMSVLCPDKHRLINPALLPWISMFVVFGLNFEPADIRLCTLNIFCLTLW